MMIAKDETPSLDAQAKYTCDPEKTSADIEELETVTSKSLSRGSDKHVVFGVDAPAQLSACEEQRLYRKIDMRLLPMLIVMQLVSYLDRGNIGNAKLQGLTTQLHLTGDSYNVALALYFVPYILLECPASLVMKKLRPSRWLPGIVMIWGVAGALMGLVKTYAQLVGLRLTLGGLEAGLFPCVTWYLSMWYPKHKLYYRMAMFWGGATIAGAFSGLLAFGISFMSGTEGMLGWPWIFILEGIFTVLIGFIGLFAIVDCPATAKFLTPTEREYVVWRLKYSDSIVGEDESFQWRHVRAALSDWQVYSNGLLFMSFVGPLYGISFFLPSIINSFGFSPATSQLLTVPPYAFATFIGILFSVWSDRKQIRSPFIFLGQAMSLIGFGIQISNAHFAVKYFGTFFCVAGGYGVFPSLPSWISNNTSGQYKRGMAIAVNVAFGNTAGSIATALFRSQDAPRYIRANAVELGFVSMGMVVLGFQVLMYRWINSKRDKAMPREGIRAVYTDRQLRDMGDKAPGFRYIL
ncbi:hypothetical protein PHLGIDRAFT_407948 [Phlebiopsis gigantea 11061_1 CR5-6]|uniref:Major facilitator superfamily (MFS) profile domain-containing protein n=1 Tax=Phlebiopsis gigantea (strain 11061_1 CR5-6) TaxID=745531 RepID=A0A0C3S8W0_PHLG1|nr:hypothetical protein PHLGIDRAFT_407948 [Phlebiopsis gigantea 11061_1 CR5-6]